jgi:NADH-ubiquinone oxidoreductase chain 1
MFKGAILSITLGLKTCLLIFVFIWARASFPRIRYDQLMSYCWTVLLPIIIGFIIVVPCLVFSLSIIPVNFYLI